MALVQCLACDEKIIEDKDSAILFCPKCGGSSIKVLKFDEEEE